jgi:hypothetical protein
MNTELRKVNGNKEENCQTAVICKDDGYQNGTFDPQFECKLEVHSEGEDEQEYVTKQQMTGNYVGIAVKEENTDPKGTTEDETYVLLIEVPYHITSGRFLKPQCSLVRLSKVSLP